MGYLKIMEWEVVPESNATVRRNCPKCSKKTEFVNTEKFRVNANKSLIDVWLIYQCNKCKSTWNMTIYERTNVADICREEYKRFLLNDKELAARYGSDISIHNKNRSEVVLDSLEYHVNIKELIEFSKNDNAQEIIITCKHPIQLRVDKLLSKQLNISRSKIKNLHQDGLIYNLDVRNLLNSRVEDGMVIYLKMPC